MRLAPSRAVEAVPNVTPMIDVMLVLLVIFMVAAPTLLSGVPAVPPAAMYSSNRPEQPADQVLAIDAKGGFYLDRRRIEKALLPAALASIYVRRASDRVLYLHADRAVDYGVVLEAMDIAAQNGVAVVGMISEQPPAKGQGRNSTKP